MKILATYWRYFYIMLLGMMLAFYPNLISDGKSKPSGFSRNFTISSDQKILGIDISKHNGDIDWETIAMPKTHKPKFVFMKATEGTSSVDAKFKSNWKESKRAGIIRGAYHFFLIDKNPRIQAYNFLSQAWPTKGDLPPVLDFETLQLRNFSVSYVTERLAIWLQIVEKNIGVRPIIYTNEGLYKRYIKDKFDSYPIWISDFHKEEIKSLSIKEPVFWQYSESGTLKGIDTPVDLNVFLGSQHKFDKYLIH